MATRGELGEGAIARAALDVAPKFFASAGSWRVASGRSAALSRENVTSRHQPPRSLLGALNPRPRPEPRNSRPMTQLPITTSTSSAIRHSEFRETTLRHHISTSFQRPTYPEAAKYTHANSNPLSPSRNTSDLRTKRPAASGTNNMASIARPVISGARPALRVALRQNTARTAAFHTTAKRDLLPAGPRTPLPSPNCPSPLPYTS